VLDILLGFILGYLVAGGLSFLWLRGLAAEQIAVQTLLVDILEGLLNCWLTGGETHAEEPDGEGRAGDSVPLQGDRGL